MHLLLKKFMNRQFSAIVIYPSSLVQLTQAKRSMNFFICCDQAIYRTRAIITRSRFETALDYKPRIFKVRKVSLHYKPLCIINRGL